MVFIWPIDSSEDAVARLSMLNTSLQAKPTPSSPPKKTTTTAENDAPSETAPATIERSSKKANGTACPELRNNWIPPKPAKASNAALLAHAGLPSTQHQKKPTVSSKAASSSSEMTTGAQPLEKNVAEPPLRKNNTSSDIVVFDPSNVKHENCPTTPTRKRTALELDEQKSDERRKKRHKVKVGEQKDELEQVMGKIEKDVQKWMRTFYVVLSDWDRSSKVDEQGRLLVEKLRSEALTRYRLHNSWAPPDNYHDDVIQGWTII